MLVYVARALTSRLLRPVPGRIVLLFIPLSLALGLATRAALKGDPPVSAQDDVARVAKEYQGAPPSAALRDILAQPDLIPTHDHPLVGERAPGFTLADSAGKTWTLDEILDGRPVVLIFYYGYHCDHCVRQLFDVNRDLPLFHEIGARVVAISADPGERTRERFQQYGSFGFPVLCDPDNKTAHAYQVFRGEAQRHGTFVLDRHGTVRWVNVGDAPFRRNSALLSHLARMGGALR